MTNRSIALLLAHSENMIRKRLADMARQALIKENIISQNFKLTEDIAYDGFETFTNTQFSPCYLNTAVGSKSFYTYATTYSYMNRKGRMTEKQKQIKAELEQQYGAYPRDSIRTQTTYIIKKLLKYHRETLLTLITDEHKAYRNSLKYDICSKKICHYTVSSKAPRTPLNPLFPVNHLHLLIRHFNAAHRRETIAFNKNEAGIIDSITIHRIDKNFMRFKFSKKTRQTPAMLAGITDHLLHFHDFFDLRRHATHANFDPQEMDQYRRIWKHSRCSITPYTGR